MRHTMPSLAITLVLLILMSRPGTSTGGKWTQLASNLAQGGKIPPPGDIFVVCNCASYRCMDCLILKNYDVASAVVSITASS